MSVKILLKRGWGDRYVVRRGRKRGGDVDVDETLTILGIELLE